MMRSTAVALVVAVAVGLATAGPVRAEHGAAARPEPGLDVRMGTEGFDVGARVFGRYGAWLSGRVGKGGLSLDGRVERPGEARGFTLDLGVPRLRLRTWEAPDIRL
jgi:hypothetical protein